MNEDMAERCLAQLRTIETIFLGHGEWLLAAQLSLVIDRIVDRGHRPHAGFIEE